MYLYTTTYTTVTAPEGAMCRATVISVVTWWQVVFSFAFAVVCASSWAFSHHHHHHSHYYRCDSSLISAIAGWLASAPAVSIFFSFRLHPH